MRASMFFVGAMLLVRMLSVQATAQPKLQGTFAGHTSSVTSVAFSNDGNTLASGSSDKSIKLWDVKTGKNSATLEGEHGIWFVSFGPDDNTLVSFSADKTIRVWDVKTGKTTRTFEVEWAVAISPDGKLLASANEVIKLWDLTTGMNIAMFDGHKQVRVLAFSPDGRDITTGKNTATLQGHVGSFGAESVGCVTFSPDGKILASGGHTIRLWEAITGKPLAILEGHEIGGGRSLAFSPDGKTLAAGGRMKDYTIKLWDVSQVIAKPEVPKEAKRDGDAPQQPSPEAVDVRLAGRITKEKNWYFLTDAKGKKVTLTLLVLRDPNLSGTLIEPDWIRLYVGQDVIVSGRGLLSNSADPTTVAHLAVTKVVVKPANRSPR